MDCEKSNKMLTVVIPTYNRANRLKMTLEALVNQSLSGKLFDILVVDDGSTDETEQMIRHFEKQVTHTIRYFWQENRSAGTARNLGINKAETPVVLLMDSDIIPNDEHLSVHHKIHKKYPQPEIAVLGMITTGKQGIDLLRESRSNIESIGALSGGESIISHAHFVTADVSLKKDFLSRAGLFTNGIPANQDMDLAMRLKKQGMKLVYCPEAVAVHTDPLDSIEKVIDNGKKYGRAYAEWDGILPIYQEEIWNLGARFDAGWKHLKRYPLNYIKDALRRMVINRMTIKPLIYMAGKIPITNPPKKVLLRCCKEIWAFYYRDEFYRTKRRFKKGGVA